MARAKRKLPKFTGELAKPIDTGILLPMNPELFSEYSDRNYAELYRIQKTKIPLLAKLLGIQFEHLDLSNNDDLLSFYACLAMNLAILVCPGFQTKKRGKTPREFVRGLRILIDKAKLHGQYKSDLDACRDYLSRTDPELARPRNRAALLKRARTLRNLVARDRADFRRTDARKRNLH